MRWTESIIPFNPYIYNAPYPAGRTESSCDNRRCAAKENPRNLIDSAACSLSLASWRRVQRSADGAAIVTVVPVISVIPAFRSFRPVVLAFWWLGSFHIAHSKSVQYNKHTYAYAYAYCSHRVLPVALSMKATIYLALHWAETEIRWIKDAGKRAKGK